MTFDFKKFAGEVYQKAMDKDITSNAAQVAFYFIFALFPLMLFLLSLFGIILGSSNHIKIELFLYLQQVMPVSAFDLVEKTLTEVADSSSGGKLTFGILVGLWSASAGIDNIRIALNDISNLPETRPWWKYKLTSVLLTLGIALLVFLALGVIFYGSQFIALILSPITIINSPLILRILSFVVVAVTLILAFALIYSFAPNRKKIRWQWITPGAITAIILWVLFSAGFRFYLQYFDSYAQTYGSLGAIIILLLWLYLTALVILIGGVVNAAAEEFTAAKKSAESSEKN